MEIVTKMLVDYLEKEVLVFRVYGFADVKAKSKQNVKKPLKKTTSSTSQNNQSSYLGDQSTEASFNNSNQKIMV